MFLATESQMFGWSYVSAVFIALILFMGTDAFAIKPSPPLILSLTNLDLPNGQIELTLEAEAKVAGVKAALAIVLPPSVSLISGEVKWNGQIAVGEKKEIKALIRTLSNNPEKVIGFAEVSLPQGGFMTQQETVLLNTPQETRSPEPLKKPKQEHDTIFEFKEK